jgi:hypothetical protein
VVRYVRGETAGEVDAYTQASTQHDQTECGGTWRAHSDPQERLDCIRTSDAST